MLFEYHIREERERKALEERAALDGKQGTLLTTTGDINGDKIEAGEQVTMTNVSRRMWQLETSDGRKIKVPDELLDSLVKS